MSSQTVPVGVLVVNWKGADDTVACLESLRMADPGPLRVVVVDNDSADDSVARIEKWGRERAPAPDWLTLVQSGSNLGFAGGNNAGLPLLDVDHRLDAILLLNNDATVAADFFREIERARLADPRAGIIGATIYRFPAIDDVWFAGGRTTPLRALVSHENVRPATAEPRETGFITGCAMLVTREALARLGPLPACYDPGYMEDAEYCWQARENGLRVIYAPAAVAYHKVGASFRKVSSPTITYAINRNRVLFARRNLGGLVRLGALAYLAATKPVRAFVDLLTGRPQHASAVLRGTLEGFRSASGTRTHTAGKRR